MKDVRLDSTPSLRTRLALLTATFLPCSRRSQSVLRVLLVAEGETLVHIEAHDTEDPVDPEEPENFVGILIEDGLMTLLLSTPRMKDVRSDFTSLRTKLALLTVRSSHAQGDRNRH